MNLGVGVDPVLQWALRGSLALLFLGASRHKLRAPIAFRASLANYQLLPERSLAWAAPSIAGFELVIGVSLVLPGFDGIWGREQILAIAEQTAEVARLLTVLAREHAQTSMPGYSHARQAMPTTLGHAFGAHAESLLDDLPWLCTCYEHLNRSPLIPNMKRRKSV